MLKTKLVASRNGREYHSYDGYDGDPVLVTTRHAEHDGHFVSAVWTTATAGTTVIASKNKEGIVLTDLIISAEKLTGGYITIQFNDADSNNVVIMRIDMNDAPVNMAIPFNGKWAGWQGSYVEVIVVGNNMDGCLALGYYRTPEEKTLAYDAWDAER